MSATPTIYQCPSCSTLQPAGGHGACRSCGYDLTGATPQAFAISQQTPRQLAEGADHALKRNVGRFQVLFGGIWLGVGLGVTLPFCVVGAFFFPMLLAVPIGAFFAIAGAIILGIGLRKRKQARWLLEHGDLTFGTVSGNAVDHTMRINKVPSQKITVGYERAGEEREVSERTWTRNVIDGNPVGQLVPVLVHPGDPDLAAAPTLIGVEFVVPEPLIDVRPTAVAATPAVYDVAPFSVTTRPVSSPTVSPAGLFGWFEKQVADENGHIQLDGNTLTQVVDDRTTQIDLSRPFAVELGCMLDAPGSCELSVELRDSHSGEKVGFRVRLPQSQVAQRLPFKATVQPWLHSDDFTRLWPVLVGCAEVHGRQLNEVSSARTERLKLPGFENEQAQAPQTAVEQTTR